MYFEILRKTMCVNITVAADIGGQSVLAAQSCGFLTVNKIPIVATFFVFQLHTFSQDDLLLVSAEQSPTESELGSNIGLVAQLFSNESSASFTIHNNNSKEVAFSFGSSSYLSKVFPAKMNAESLSNCEDVRLKSDLVYKLYARFLDDELFFGKSHVSGFDVMSSVDRVRQNAFEVCSLSVATPKIFTVAHWPRLAVAYSVIVSNGSSVGGNAAASYASIVVGGCSKNWFGASCEQDDIFVWLVMGAYFVVGLFLCFCGHRFFALEIFSSGLLSGCLITYILLLRYTSVSQFTLSSATLTLGIIVGLLWYAVWYFHGRPLESMLLPAMLMGFLMSSTVIYIGLGSIDLLRQSFVTYCMFLAVITMLTTLLIISLAKIGNIICCSVIGSFLVTIALSIYTDETIHHILIKSIERLSVVSYEIACFPLPFFTGDVVLALTWAVLSIVGISIQFHTTRGSAPFPPCPYIVLRQQNQGCELCPSFSAWCRNSRRRHFGVGLQDRESQQWLLSEDQEQSASTSYGTIHSDGVRFS